MIVYTCNLCYNFKIGIYSIIPQTNTSFFKCKDPTCFELTLTLIGNGTFTEIIHNHDSFFVNQSSESELMLCS